MNFAKRGISLSIGGPGASMNFSRRGERTTVGLPGTGISYIETSPHYGASPAPTAKPHHHWWLWLLAILAGLWLLGSLLPPPLADAETLRCSTSFQGYRTCQGSDGFRSFEWDNGGYHYGGDNRGNKWTTFNGVGGEITINRRSGQ